jgi:hypothetical protein
MSLHALLFCFWANTVQLAFITSHNVQQEITVLNSMLLKQL